MGGGTFDVSIANIDSTGVRVIAVGGDRELGGKDIDETMKKLVINDLRSSKGKVLDEYGNHQVDLAVEKAKIELTKNTFAAIAIQNLSTTTGSIPYYKKITISLSIIDSSEIFSKDFSSLILGTYSNTLFILTEEDATNEEVIEALKAAQAYDFVSKMQEGIDSIIYEGGKNFSGGQKQRLAIARALVKKPSLIIFPT